jgi:hypothetical protein
MNRISEVETGPEQTAHLYEQEGMRMKMMREVWTHGAYKFSHISVLIQNLLCSEIIYLTSQFSFLIANV